METQGKYILINGEVVEETDLLIWAKWMQTTKRQIQEDMIGNVRVSTVFLGLNHNFGKGPPVFWETMIFGGALDKQQARYISRELAIKGHQDFVEQVRRGDQS